MDAKLGYYVNHRGWETIVHLLKPKNESYSSYLLAVRERATGLTKEQLKETSGLAYWNHALYFHLSDIEARAFKTICGDADNFEEQFGVFYSRLINVAFSVKKNYHSCIYAVSVYGGTDENTLKGYIVVPPKGFGASQLKKLYDLWSWTRPKR